MSKLFLTMIIGSVLNCLYDIFIVDRISKKEAKKSNYNCNNCQNWKCYKKYCDEMRKK